VTETPIVQLVAQDLERGLELLSQYSAFGTEAATLWDELRRALYATWARLPYLVFAVDAEGLSWDGERVLTRDEAPGLVGTLADTGIATLTIVPGAELEEIPLFLTVLHRAQALTPEDEDDLLTLLWRQDFDRIHYKLAVGGTEPDSDAEEGENDSMFLDLELLDLAAAEIVREQVRQEAKAPETQRGVVQLEKFDSTLYFLDQPEIEYLRAAIERDYAQNYGSTVSDYFVRGSSANPIADSAPSPPLAVRPSPTLRSSTDARHAARRPQAPRSRHRRSGARALRLHAGVGPGRRVDVRRGSGLGQFRSRGPLRSVQDPRPGP
jgi:hypothetical protein